MNYAPSLPACGEVWSQSTIAGVDETAERDDYLLIGQSRLADSDVSRYDWLVDVLVVGAELSDPSTWQWQHVRGDGCVRRVVRLHEHLYCQLNVWEIGPRD